MPDPTLDRTDLFRSDMSGVCAKLSPFGDWMGGNQPELIIKNPQQTAVVTDPHLAAQKLRRRAVAGPINRDVSVAGDLAPDFVIERKSIRWELCQRRTFQRFKRATDLFASRSVDPRVGNIRFPTMQVFVLRRKRLELMTAERVLLHIVDPAFDLALVTRRSHASRNERAAIVLAELDDLRIQFRIVPVGGFDRAFGIVKYDPFRNTTESPECVLQRTNEILRVLLEDRFRVALA